MSRPVYYPRCLVLVTALFDDQVGGAVPATWSCVPKSVEITRNNARTADTCRLQLDYRDFPLDPRLLKAVHVSVHLEAVIDPTIPLVPWRLNLRFIGIVDTPEVTLSASGESVSLDARDYTAIWMGRSWRSLVQPIRGPKGGSAYVLATPVGMTLGMLVEQLRLAITPLTAPALFMDPTSAALQPWMRTGRATFAPEPEDTAWDLLIRLCDLFGLTPVWELDQLVIRTAAQAGIGSAFMVYGQNVERLMFRRNLQKPEEKNVKVVAWNPVAGISLEAAWPPPSSLPLDLGENGTPKATTAKYVQYHVEGPYDPATLAQLAQRVHAELAQAKLEGELETRDMTDLFEASLVGLGNGDLLVCRLGTEVQASIAGMSPAEAVLFLSDPSKPNSLSPTVAQALVSAWTAAQSLAVQFYISEATHRWDREDGYRLTIGFRDYVLGV